jgi:hypothetical protein
VCRVGLLVGEQRLALGRAVVVLIDLRSGVHRTERQIFCRNVSTADEASEFLRSSERL